MTKRVIRSDGNVLPIDDSLSPGLFAVLSAQLREQEAGMNRLRAEGWQVDCTVSIDGNEAHMMTRLARDGQVLMIVDGEMSEIGEA